MTHLSSAPLFLVGKQRLEDPAHLLQPLLKHHLAGQVTHFCYKHTLHFYVTRALPVLLVQSGTTACCLMDVQCLIQRQQDPSMQHRSALLDCLEVLLARLLVYAAEMHFGYGVLELLHAGSGIYSHCR